jgi:hypothetical protein
MGGRDLTYLPDPGDVRVGDRLYVEVEYGNAMTYFTSVLVEAIEGAYVTPSFRFANEVWIEYDDEYVNLYRVSDDGT